MTASSWMKNADYWQDGKPYLDRITFRYITDEQTDQQRADGTREVDVAPEARARASVEHARGGGRPRIEVNPVAAAWTLCYFNFSRPPFNDAGVRRAVTLAVDREAINEALAFGLGRTGERGVPAGLLGRRIRTLASTFTLDVDQARELMAEAGVRGRDVDQGADYTGTAPRHA